MDKVYMFFDSKNRFYLSWKSHKGVGGGASPIQDSLVLLEQGE